MITLYMYIHHAESSAAVMLCMCTWQAWAAQQEAGTHSVQATLCCQLFSPVSDPDDNHWIMLGSTAQVGCLVPVQACVAAGANRASKKAVSLGGCTLHHHLTFFEAPCPPETAATATPEQS
jgi:hypothetical protein